MPEFWISRVTSGLPIFVKKTAFWIDIGRQLWKGSEYFRILNMPDFCIWKHYKRFWICLNKLFDYGRVLNMPGQSFIGFWICKGYTWCWICLNKPEYALNITSTAKQKLLKMCHLRHRLRIFFFFFS